MSANALRQRLAAELRQAAEATGDARFNVAAGILCGNRPGRRRRDDAGAVAQIHVLIEAGVANNATAAARLVAKTRREAATVESAAKQMAAAYRRAQVEK